MRGFIQLDKIKSIRKRKLKEHKLEAKQNKITSYIVYVCNEIPNNKDNMQTNT